MGPSAQPRKAGQPYRGTVSEVRIFVILLPLVAAGVAQGFVIKRNPWPALALPLDGGREWRGRPILGPNKTVRGVLVMVTATAVASAVVFRLIPPAPAPTYGWFGVGILLGLGYALAELPNSFVKRRLGVQAGTASKRGRRLQYLADQGDSVVGVVLVVACVFDFSARALVALGLAGLLVHILFDRGLHATGVKTRAAPQ